jgi:hypothetical protein
MQVKDWQAFTRPAGVHRSCEEERACGACGEEHGRIYSFICVNKEQAMSEMMERAKRGPDVVSGPLKFWMRDGEVLVSGLFEMLDQEGFPLSASLTQCKKHGFTPCIDDFKARATLAGWSKEKINRTIGEAMADLNYGPSQA